MSKKAKYHTREFELHPGDCVFVYTDGVPEANNVSGKMFGEERLAATLNQDPEQSPKDLIHRLHDAVERLQVAEVAHGLGCGQRHHGDEADGVAPEELADALRVAEHLGAGVEERDDEPEAGGKVLERHGG